MLPEGGWCFVDKRSSKYQILIADAGYGQYRRSLARKLGECSFAVRSDRLNACEFFSQNHVDLVLLDHFHDALCLEIVKYMKSLRPYVPIMVLTDCGSESFAVEAFRTGISDYFRKPVNVDELSSSVRAVLGIAVRGERRVAASRNGVEKAVQYIHGHYSTRLSLAHAARMAGMSVSCFERKFKRETGDTFVNYVNKFRIAKAIDLMRTEELPMSDVAFACGFSNQFHFTRTFKKIIMKSPLQYKKTLMR